MRWPVLRAYLAWDRLSTGIALCALVLSLALAACGKRSAPIPPPNEPNTYPRPYPSE
jgi:hypothetical protein